MSSIDLTDDFTPVTAEQWRARVQRDLGDRDFDRALVTRLLEGIDVQPLYTEADTPTARDPGGSPGAAPFTRGARPVAETPSTWDIRQEFAHPDPATTAREIAEDLAGGVTSIHLVVNPGSRPDGTRLTDASTLESALGDVDLGALPLSLDAGAASLPTAQAALALGVHRGALGVDPSGTLARDGALPTSLAAAQAAGAELAASLGQTRPDLTVFSIDTRAWHLAGASEDLDLGIALSTGAAALRAMAAAGLDPAQANQRIGFRVALGCDFLLGVCKLRALRATWSRLMGACGAAAGPAHVHTFPADRALTGRAPWVNILRVTAATFAGAVGGADAITATPWDRRLGSPDADSRRLARNTQHMLALESHLGWPIDAAGGSWAMESMTAQLAEGAWAALQSLESGGGMGTRQGIEAARARLASPIAVRQQKTARRQLSRVGVDQFAHLDEVTPPRLGWGWTAPTKDAVNARRVVAPAPGERIPALVPAPIAGPWEALRDASDRARATDGRRPRTYLATLGPLSAHNARASWMRNLLEAGGVDVIEAPDGDDPLGSFAHTPCVVACICSSDAVYSEQAAAAVRNLRGAGAKIVLGAGKPNGPLSASGVDDCAFHGGDVLALVRSIHDAQGARS
jgi:methylmalonyl-CoA mutase